MVKKRTEVNDYINMLEHHRLEERRLLNSGYKLIGSGTKRKAYLNPEGTFVVKIAIDGSGIFENINEHRAYKEASEELQSRMARCNMLEHSILVMEYVREVEESMKSMIAYRHKWVEEFNYQVGFNSKGRLVAYDYG